MQGTGQTRAGGDGKCFLDGNSCDPETLAILRQHADSEFDGNLSAAFASAAKWLRQREARRKLVERLGGSVLTPGAAAAIDAEQAGAGAAKRRRARKKAA